MERRSHRCAVLLGVAALHVPVLALLLQIGDVTPLRVQRADNALRVEWVLREAGTALPADPALQVRRTADAPAASAAARPSPATSSVATATIATTQASFVPEAEPARLLDEQGRPRVPSRLLDELDAAQAQRDEASRSAARTFHAPAGDTWVMRDATSPIDAGLTRFSRSWLPSDMNPLEEACWRNKALALVMSIVGSQDCANPGGKAPRPPPQMLVHGRDDARTTLRKIEEWEDYSQR